MIKNKVLRRVRWRERVRMVAFGVVAIGSNVVGADDSALLDALVVISVNAWLSWNLTGNLYGGFATSPAPFSIANGNSDTVLAVDFMMKF